MGRPFDGVEAAVVAVEAGTVAIGAVGLENAPAVCDGGGGSVGTVGGEERGVGKGGTLVDGAGAGGVKG